eukprot:209371-Alexandrium_andersonii.AAC.1
MLAQQPTHHSLQLTSPSNSTSLGEDVRPLIPDPLRVSEHTRARIGNGGVPLDLADAQGG